METTRNDIGTFELLTGECVLADPCYDIDTWCIDKLTVKPGIWKAFILTIHVVLDKYDLGDMVAYLICHHEDHPSDLLSLWAPEAENILGVDSGQLGMFDIVEYKGDGWCDEEEWYHKCCNLTDPAGILPHGVVSSSGIGDGSYSYYQLFDPNGTTVGIKIDFCIDEDSDVEEAI